jgi:Endonuclease V
MLEGEQVGAWVRRRDGVRPVAVHPAWRTDIDTAVAVVLRTAGSHRTPEALRWARRLARLSRAAGERCSRLPDLGQDGAVARPRCRRSPVWVTMAHPSRRESPRCGDARTRALSPPAGVWPFSVGSARAGSAAGYVGAAVKAFAVRDGRLPTDHQQYGGRRVAGLVVAALGI